jgi:hypothetical protein
MLGAPQIAGVLSECSRGVQFQGLVPGATLRLQPKQSAPVDQWTVVNADQASGDMHPLATCGRVAAS